MTTTLITIATLVTLGVFLAVILYIVAQKFKVEEDPRIDDVEALLPGANCGGCGYAGCRAFATASVGAADLSLLYCPVGGNEGMANVSKVLGLAAVAKDPQVAVVRCNGTFCARPRTNSYEGATSCAIASSLYSGDTGCSFGCLGKGDCVLSCKFDAIHMNPETGLPEVDQDKCTACGTCITACPKMIIELRKKGPKNRRVFVSCINKDKGGIAKKACSSACTACTKCVKVCKFDAIAISQNLACIDFNKCTLCRKCVSECPTSAIIETNFPPRVVKREEVPAEAATA
ncbi:MAG: RnfABCDGE type electron transport complex subunit B [Prevotellaceae bacterium]|jgi:Na+-translocating ferredoxin:NAD+ oxidoreductase RNF subunit RnfB|nr:RnfABCDGE type electron transport complex subunit B [Prevotellaceae bacterium]